MSAVPFLMSGAASAWTETTLAHCAAVVMKELVLFDPPGVDVSVPGPVVIPEKKENPCFSAEER